MANPENLEAELHEEIALLYLLIILIRQIGQPHDVCIVSERGGLASPGSGERRARGTEVHPPKDPTLHKPLEVTAIGLDRQIKPRIITDIPCTCEDALAF